MCSLLTNKVYGSPEVLAHGDVYEGVDDGVDEGEEEEDDAIVVDRVGELEEAQLQQSLHNKPGKNNNLQFSKIRLTWVPSKVEKVPPQGATS